MGFSNFLKSSESRDKYDEESVSNDENSDISII